MHNAKIRQEWKAMEEVPGSLEVKQGKAAHQNGVYIQEQQITRKMKVEQWAQVLILMGYKWVSSLEMM